MNYNHRYYFVVILFIGIACALSACRSEKMVFTPTIGYDSNQMMRSTDSLFVQVKSSGFAEAEAQSKAIFLADSTLRADVIAEFLSIVKQFEQSLAANNQVNVENKTSILKLEKCVQEFSGMRYPRQIVRVQNNYDNENQEYTSYVLVGVDTATMNAIFLKCMYRRDKLYAVFKSTPAFDRLNQLFPTK